jgi:hypothetical protein
VAELDGDSPHCCNDIGMPPFSVLTAASWLLPGWPAHPDTERRVYTSVFLFDLVLGCYKQPILSDMSGPPILTADGSAAVGIVNISTENSLGPHGPNPRLLHHLSGWLLNALRPKVSLRKSKHLAIANRGPAARPWPARGMLP